MRDRLGLAGITPETVAGLLLASRNGAEPSVVVPATR
jgi:hypothetical protein